MIARPRLFIGANNQVMRELFKCVKEQTINFLHISEANCLGELMTLQNPLALKYAEYNWESQPDLDSPKSYDTLSSSLKATSGKYEQPDGEQPSCSGVNLKHSSSEEDEEQQKVKKRKISKKLELKPGKITSTCKGNKQEEKQVIFLSDEEFDIVS